MEKIIKIDGMSCSHCTSAVKEELSRLEGVTSVDVNLEAKEARVEFTGDLSDMDLKGAVEEAGFEVMAIG